MSHFKFYKGQVMVCIGSGGVGKTSIAAGLGVLAAEEGFRVLVLTIDPSQRLAQTLGIENSKDIVKVPGQTFKGELFASVVDHKKTFDEFIQLSTKYSETAKKILDNKLYQQLSTNLSGSQEFTCLEKLYSVYESKQFDVIILDTPPAEHAIDFLEAPQKLARLFNEGIVKWFKDPSGKKQNILTQIINQSTKQVLKALEILTGSSFIRELSDFFIRIEEHRDKLQERVLASQSLLMSERTEFYLVASPDPVKLKEAQRIAKSIKKNGFHLEQTIINRSQPLWAYRVEANSIRNAQLKDFSLEMREYYTQVTQDFKKYGPHIEVPECEEDIASLKDVVHLTKYLKDNFYV